MRDNPATWGPRIAAMEPENRPGRDLGNVVAIAQPDRGFVPRYRRYPSRLNVGFVGEAFSRVGGTETWHETLLPRLQGHGIHVVGYSVSLPPQRDTEALGGIPVGHGERSHRAILGACDVAVVWGVPDLPALLPTPRPRVVSVIHGDGSLPYFREVEAAHAPVVDLFASVLPSGFRVVPDGWSGSTRVIANAIDPRKATPSRPRAETREALGVGPDDVLVVWPHRYSSEKRGWLAVEAARLLPPGWVVLLVGEGHEREALASRAAGTCARVIGPRDDMGDLLTSADIVLSTSETEGFGLSVAESMLAGTPVVGTPVGVLADHPGLARMLPVDATPHDVAGALTEDRSHWVDATARAARAQRFVRERWGVDTFVSSWVDAIRSVAPAPEPPLPSPVRQAVGLARAAVQAVASAAAPAPPEVVAERIRICESCEFFRASDRRCGGRAGCGCYVDIKAQLRDWDCPRERWPK